MSFEIDTELYPAELLKRFLSFYESLKLKEKKYIIIDEYDNFTNAILGKYLNLFKNVLGNDGFVKPFYAAIKSKCGILIDRVFITGVCSVSLDSMTSGFNIATNITNYNIFNEMTALSHEEVKKNINDMNVDNSDEIFDIMLENYDGYKFSDDASELVFNPTLVIYFLNYYNNFKKVPKNIIDYNILSNYEQIKGIPKIEL